MKTFIKKILLFLLIAAVLGGLANLGFYLYMGRMTPAYTDRFVQAPEGIQFANLGSSHGQSGFCYEHAPDSVTANLAFGSQTLQYDVRILERYIDRFAAGSTLYMPVSYNSFLTTSGGSDFLSLNRRYYYILPRELIMEFSWREWLTARAPGLFVPNWLSEYWRSDEFDETRDHLASDIDVQADAQEAVERHILSHRSPSGYAFQPDNVACLLGIISLCREHDVTPILVTTPFLREYNELVPEDFLAAFHATIDEICMRENVQYLDFSQDRRFVDSYELFLNSDHLNYPGSLVFTDLLLAGGMPEA